MSKLKNKILVALICSLFIGNSLVFPQQTSTVSDTVPMSGINSPSAGRLQIDHEASSLSSALNPYNISIPEQFGQIEEVFQGAANSPLVVHIQNVHANYEAQVNIKNILNHLVDQYQFSLIQLEGAISKLDPAILQPSYLKEANLKLVDFLMREGRITGADAYAVETDKPVELYGIEDYSLYMENLKMFKAIYKHQEDLKPYFDEVHRLILSVGPKLLKPEQLDFTRKTEEFSTDKIDLMDYLVYMNKLSEKNKLVSLNELAEMVDYPNLTRLMRLKNLEEELNKAGLKKETEAIKVEFQKKMPNSEKVNELLSHLDENAKGTNPRDYFLELTKLADEAKIDFITYPAFRIFAEFLIHQDEIDHRALFSELKAFEHMLQEKLFTSEDEKLFLSIIDRVGLLEQFFRLEMSREKIALYLKDKDRVTPSSIFTGLDELAKKSNVAAKPVGDIQKLDSYMDEVEYFYQLVLKRDEVFIDKILTQIKSHSLDKTIIVTGGFHKDGLVDYFRKEKISYVIINPKVDVKEGNKNYLKVMLEEDAVAGSVFAGTFALEIKELLNSKLNGDLDKINLRNFYAAVAPLAYTLDTREPAVVRAAINEGFRKVAPASGVLVEVGLPSVAGNLMELKVEAKLFQEGRPRRYLIPVNFNVRDQSFSIDKEKIEEIPAKGQLKAPAEPLQTVPIDRGAGLEPLNINRLQPAISRPEEPVSVLSPVIRSLILGGVVIDTSVPSSLVKSLVELKSNPVAVNRIRELLTRASDETTTAGQIANLIKTSNYNDIEITAYDLNQAVAQASNGGQDLNKNNRLQRIFQRSDTVQTGPLIMMAISEETSIEGLRSELQNFAMTVQANPAAVLLYYALPEAESLKSGIPGIKPETWKRIRIIPTENVENSLNKVQEDLKSGRAFNAYYSLGKPGGPISIPDLKKNNRVRILRPSAPETFGRGILDLPGVEILQIISSIQNPQVLRDRVLREGVAHIQSIGLGAFPTSVEPSEISAALLKNGLDNLFSFVGQTNTASIPSQVFALVRQLELVWQAAAEIAKGA